LRKYDRCRTFRADFEKVRQMSYFLGLRLRGWEAEFDLAVLCVGCCPLNPPILGDFWRVFSDFFCEWELLNWRFGQTRLGDCFDRGQDLR
jgi:hypothetical protein